MPKFFFLLIALLWTGIVSYFCLVESNDIPVVNIPNLDKIVHFFFHFVLTSVWFLFFYNQLKSIVKPLLISFLFSFLFGIGIEFLQGLLTATRQADFLDVLANSAGAMLSVFAVLICNKYNLFKVILKN